MSASCSFSDATGALRCWAEIDPAALRHNALVCRDQLGDGGDLVAVVKADAYGHGVECVVEAMADEVSWFAVANVREAQVVRRTLAEKTTHGREHRILILGPALPQEREEIVREGFRVSVSSGAEAERWGECAERLGKVVFVHLVVDTGMGRIGVCADEAGHLLETIRAVKGCHLEGVSTHFPAADEDEPYTREQIGIFRGLVESLELDAGVLVHLCNSAGILHYADMTTFATLARGGLALYGASPLPAYQDLLRPVLTWKTQVTLVREVPAGSTVSYGRTYTCERSHRIATLAVGYGDGYPRHLSGSGACVLIRGRRCPLLGRVTMDQILVDVTHLPELPEPGEEVVLMGRQGAESITAAELAEKAGTIPWEIFTGISKRVVRTTCRGSR